MYKARSKEILYNASIYLMKKCQTIRMCENVKLKYISNASYYGHDTIYSGLQTWQVSIYK